MMTSAQHQLSDALMELEIADGAFALLIEKADNRAERKRLKFERRLALAKIQAECERCRGLVLHQA